jgi:hypothetical protein
MNRWRVGEDRRSKETDGCFLTMGSLFANIQCNATQVVMDSLFANIRDNVAHIVTGSVVNIQYNIARDVIVIQIIECIIFCSSPPLRVKGIIDVPPVAEAVIPFVGIRHARLYLLGLCMAKGCVNSETIDQVPLETKRILLPGLRNLLYAISCCI